MPLSKNHILRELSSSELLKRIGSFGMNCRQDISRPLCGSWTTLWTFCLLRSHRVMLEPSPLILARRLALIVVSEEKVRALIEPSVCLKVKRTWSVCRFTREMSPSQYPMPAICTTGLYAIIVTLASPFLLMFLNSNIFFSSMMFQSSTLPPTAKRSLFI